MDNIKEWTSSLCQNHSQGPPTEETGRGSLLNCLSCPHDDPVSQGTELNWFLRFQEKTAKTKNAISLPVAFQGRILQIEKKKKALNAIPLHDAFSGTIPQIQKTRKV